MSLDLSAEVVRTATAPRTGRDAASARGAPRVDERANAGPAMRRFDVFQGNSPDPGSIIASLPPTQTTFDVQLPGPATTRFFIVKAVKRTRAVVATPSNEVAVTPLPGAPPGAPVLSASARNKRASLSWMAPPSNDGTGAIGSYKVLRGTTAGGEALIATVAGKQTSYSDTGPLVNGTAYYYKVVASTTTFGDGSASNEQVVVPSGARRCLPHTVGLGRARRVDGDVRRSDPRRSAVRAPRKPAVVSNANGTFVFVRGGDNRLYWQRVPQRDPDGWNMHRGERSPPTRSRWPTARTSRSSSTAATTACTDR